MLVGIILGPSAANFISPERWGSSEPGQQASITPVSSNTSILDSLSLIESQGVIRVMMGVQLVIAGYQLPNKYIWSRLRELSVCVVLVKALMWVSTTLCILSTIPNLTLLSTFIMAACVTSIDPILSQSIAKGPFADKYVARPLREIISGEAGASDGFGMPFLMLGVYMMRHAEVTGETSTEAGHAKETAELSNLIIPQDSIPGRLGGSLGDVMKDWFLETWLYTVLLGAVYGAVVGFVSCKVINVCLKRYVRTMRILTQSHGDMLMVVVNGLTTNHISSFPPPLVFSWLEPAVLLAQTTRSRALWPAVR